MGNKPTQSIWIYKSPDEEKRLLSLSVDRLSRALNHQKQKRKEAENEVKEWKKKYEEERYRNEKQQKELEIFKREIEKFKRQRDTYRSMLFKTNKPKVTVPSYMSFLPKRERGAQPGHIGYGRSVPQRVDKVEHWSKARCPTCDGKLTSKHSLKTHSVEDIPSPATQKTIVTRYEIERQWCKRCKKEVRAIPLWVIPNSRLGLHLVVQVHLEV